VIDTDDEQVIKDCKEGGAILVTWDRVVRAAADGITPHEMLDQAMKSSVEGENAEKGQAELSRLRKLTPAQLTVMAEGANDTWRHFYGHIMLTKKSARLIRKRRVDQDYSWRAIARFWSVKFCADWGGNQIAGMVICSKAAKLLGEDFMQPPWN